MPVRNPSVYVHSVSSAGKHRAGAKRGKTYSRCQVRRNMQPVSSAGKQKTGARAGKEKGHVTIGLVCFLLVMD